MFKVQTDDNVLKRFRFPAAELFSHRTDLYKKEFVKLPKTLMLTVEMGGFAIFPDIFTYPYPMVSEMVKEVMSMYRVDPFFRKVILSDVDSDQYRNYYLIYIDEREESLFSDFQFGWTKERKVCCTISLDFAESILRRNALGIKLSEIESREEILL